MHLAWDFDPRPVWRVRAVYGSSGLTSTHRREREAERLVRTLEDTGKVRGARVQLEPEQVVVTLHLRASSGQEAEEAAIYITEISCKVGECGLLGVLGQVGWQHLR